MRRASALSVLPTLSSISRASSSRPTFAVQPKVDGRVSAAPAALRRVSRHQVHHDTHAERQANRQSVAHSASKRPNAHARRDGHSEKCCRKPEVLAPALSPAGFIGHYQPHPVSESPVSTGTPVPVTGGMAWPALLSPQHTTSCCRLIAHVCARPAAMAV